MPVGTTFVEAVGPAYSEYARLSAVSGVPTAVGWENHEMVWRGPDILPETRRRRELIDTIYTSADAAEIRAAVDELGVTAVAIGDIERQDYTIDELAAVEAAGVELLCGDNGAVLVIFRAGT
jgi:uncharacterized membrane protein